MNNIINRVWKQNSMVNIEDLRGMTFQAEEAGHTFQIRGMDRDGNIIALSGTPAGILLRADHQDVTLDCSVSDGIVYATLPANAYVVPGRFGITIFLTSGGQKTAIYAAIGSVSRTSSGTVAPPAGSNVVDLVNAIQDAIALIPSSDTNLKAAMAPTYSTSAAYAVGSYAWYNGQLYRCTTAITSGETWTSGHWTLANMGGDVADLKSAFTLSGAESKIAENTYFVQGTPDAPTNANRCTTGRFKCFPGDVIKITGNASGQKCVLASSAGLDTGWKTSDFEYNVTAEANFWVNVATTAGNTPLSPSDITTLKVTINGVLNIRESLMRDYPISMEKGSIAGGTPSNSDYYCRSGEFCTACKGALLKIVNNTGFVLSNLNIYLYDERTTESYSTGYSIPNAGGGIGIGDTLKYRIPASGYFKIRVSKPGASVAMTQNDIDLLNTCFSYERMYLDERVINSTEKAGSLWDRMNGNVQYRLEIGGISGGTPSPSTNYVRNKHFIKANIGDVFTIKPNGFTVNGGAIYKYKAPITTAYDKNTSIATTASGKTFTYTFDEECYFKIRAAKNDYETLTDADVIAFESAITFNHLFGQSDFEPIAENSVALPIDYDTIRSGMSGKINIALQTDTHMELFDGYKKTDGSIFPKSDFIAFASILKSIEQVKPDVFVNLGDIVRGYEFDPDYETRASIDRIISDYAKYISSPQMYLIGNHDDGNMWYFDTRYNQKQNVENVLYPNEQFNRITKFGENNGKDQNYFYRDIGGVRFIVLWQRDFDYTQAIPGNNDFAIGADQIAWLSGTALNTSLPVVVLTHAPLISSLYEHGGTGFADTVNALKAFENGGGTVIAVLSGHTHAQNSAQADGINHIVFANGYTWFELISIDLTNRTITCKAINKTLSDISLSY